jgi:spermidine synthase
MVGVTTLISSEVISAPLIWIFPLALYLLTFVAAFARRPPVSAAAAEKYVPLALTGTLIAYVFQPPVASLGFLALFIHLCAFGVATLMCHTRLAAARPADEGRLAEFYLMISLGGALGGLLNVFVAPLVFNRAVEYPLLFLALPLLLPAWSAKRARGKVLLCLLAAALLFADFRVPGVPGMSARAAHNIPLAVNIWIAIMAVILADGRSPLLPHALTVFFIISTCLIPSDELVLLRRNFFGTIHVYDLANEAGMRVRTIMHGTTLHGLQALDMPWRDDPHTSYYDAPAAAFAAYKPRNVGVIGLGAGTLNCYTDPKRSFTFFEIDPGVVGAARDQFYYLSECKSARPPRIIVGDGRLELKKLEGEKFDLLVVDAFSSDVIPAHLLTKEALELYAARLAPRGLLMIHISNRYFSLEAPLAATAAAAGLRTKLYAQENPDRTAHPLLLGSVWVMAARPGTDLSAMDKTGAKDLKPLPGAKPWTDDYTNILSALEIFHAKTH